LKGRGAVSNPPNRYEAQHREVFDDGWDSAEETLPSLHTSLSIDHSRRVITYNDSPDVPFDRSINPYRGCEHGCIYCYARPTHAWLGHSPGLEFESRLYYKPDVVDCLRRELGASGYRCAPIAIGGITDPYQPVEQRLGLTRRILELLDQCAHPCSLVTKSALVERDLELLQHMAERRLVCVMISLTTLRRGLARRLEPRAAAPQRRLETIRRLVGAGIPVGVLIAPLIPVLTDPELEQVMEAVREAGALSVDSILLRLPLEVAPLFQEWLQIHVPGQAQRVLNRIRDTRGGALYEAEFGRRMSGRGAYAELLAQRFRLARQRLGFNEPPSLECGRFVRPGADSRQLSLF
jgi:DNA repair photolyase